jgi:hypothetical protein
MRKKSLADWSTSSLFPFFLMLAPVICGSTPNPVPIKSSVDQKGSALLARTCSKAGSSAVSMGSLVVLTVSDQEQISEFIG